MNAYTLALEQSLYRALDALEKTAKLNVVTAMSKVSSGLPSARVHKLEGSDFVSFVVNQDALRVICKRSGSVLHALWVGPHDAAYDWARRHRSIQVGHHVRTIAVEKAAPREDVAVPEVVAGALADVRDKDFARFDVPASVASALRPLSAEGLLELALLLKAPLGEALLDLSQDPGRLGPVWLEFDNRRKQMAAGTYREPTPEEAVRSVVNVGEVWIPTPSQQAVRDALESGMDAWRVFLHPSQSRLVTRHYKSAAKVTGGPGTGKTIVALHRARHLLEHVFPEGRVLLTTFNRTLATQLEQLWKQLTAGQPEVHARADILTLTEVSQQLLRSASQPSHLLVDRELLDDCWKEALALDGAGHGRAFLESEREHVIGRSGAWTQPRYLKVRRPRGRKRLSKEGRKAVWSCISAFDQALESRGGGDGLALAREATLVVSTGKVKSPWVSLVCDELQDASAGELRLLAALARGEDGLCRENALFLAGDGYQRLYASPVPLSHCGIEVRGRSSILRLNYRTTEGIRAYAVKIAEGLDPDTLDEEESSSLRGYRSLRGGDVPKVKRFASTQAEASWIAQQKQPLLVLARTRRYRDALADRLRAVGQSPHILEGRGEPPAEGITLSTLHRSKGLEASRVVVAGRQQIPARWPGGDPTDKKLWHRSELCLLYVGITRARDWCALTTVSS